VLEDGTYWTDGAFVDRRNEGINSGVNRLRALGVPEILVGLFLKLGRRGSA
jgi:hypothetical protein